MGDEKTRKRFWVTLILVLSLLILSVGCNTDGKETAKDETSINIPPSALVGSMYIDTESGSLDYILTDKSHKEKADMRYINGNGDVKYDGDR